MNIKDILAPYHDANMAFLEEQRAFMDKMANNGNMLDVWMVHFLLAGLILGLIAGLWFSVRNKEMRALIIFVCTGFGAVVLMSLGLFLSIFFVEPHMVYEEDRPVEGDQAQVAAAAISDRVADRYGIDLSEERALDALRADDDEVISFSAEHNGVRKSLSVSVDENIGAVFIFDGEKALTPTAK